MINIILCKRPITQQSLLYGLIIFTILLMINCKRKCNNCDPVPNNTTTDTTSKNSTTTTTTTTNNTNGNSSSSNNNTGSGNSTKNELTSLNDLIAVNMVDANNGYVVGYNGVAFKTSDGGTNFTKLTTNTTNNLIDIYFNDANTGFICGSGATLLKTTDAGITWNVLSTGIYSSINFTKIYPVNSSTFYLLGTGGSIYKTTNGGANFSTISTGTSYSFYFMDILPNGNILLGGNYGTILRSTDNGTSWTQSTSSAGSNMDVFGFYFSDNNHGIATACPGSGYGRAILLKTVDGGSTWSSVTNPDLSINSSYRHVIFTSPSIGYMVGGDAINQIGRYLKTTDGGATWEAINSNTERLTGACLQGTSAYAVGFGGTFIKLQ